MKNTDLDVGSPDKVAVVLRNAASTYYASAIALEGAWQDKQAGKIWANIARILEAAAAKIEQSEARQ